MTKRTVAADKRSTLTTASLKQTIATLVSEIQQLYESDSIPWVIGYSGGKDSTAILQLVWIALKGLKPAQRQKPVHVISTDTLVENPVVALWVNDSLAEMTRSAKRQNLPIEPHRLTPAVADSFWVNLLGKGYPAPRHKFRWCTERLKISASNTFIRNMAQKNGEVVLALGSRKKESQRRAKTMKHYEKKRGEARFRDGLLGEKLNPNSELPNTWVYTPIQDWSNDDVWMYLMSFDNPWNYSNKALKSMYSDATEDGECPLVVDTSTPSCGNSRFGCWVCTLVDEDKSMTAMVRNSTEGRWMKPLLDFRNMMDFRPKDKKKRRRSKKADEDFRGDKDLRDFRRMRGNVQLYKDNPIHGPYLQSTREKWFRKLLEMEQHIRKIGPEEVRNMELITLPEMEEIRRIWVFDKHEIEDSLPRIYKEVTDKKYPGRSIDDDLAFGADEMAILKNAASNEIQYQMLRELLDIERRYRAKAVRAGLYKELEGAIRRNFYNDADDAHQYALARQNKKTDLKQRHEDEQSLQLELDTGMIRPLEDESESKESAS